MTDIRFRRLFICAETGMFNSFKPPITGRAGGQAERTGPITGSSIFSQTNIIFSFKTGFAVTPIRGCSDSLFTVGKLEQVQNTAGRS